MESHKFPDKEFKIMVLGKLTKLQENKDRPLDEIGKTIHEQNDGFNKKIEIIKWNQTDMLELKNTMTVMKKKTTKKQKTNATESFTSRLGQAEESTCALEDKAFEIIQSEE